MVIRGLPGTVLNWDSLAAITCTLFYWSKANKTFRY